MHAVVGGSISQCDTCDEYIKNDHMGRHQKKDCMSKTIRFPKWRGQFFCYLSCGRYRTKVKLMQHLAVHCDEQMKLWGINKARMVEQCSNLYYQRDRKT